MVFSLFSVSALAAGNDIPFTDVKTTDWFYKEVCYVYDEALMQGTSATTFNPNGRTNRGMIVTILYRLEGEPAFMNDNVFTDVKSGSWYEKAVVWANSKGIVKGYGNGKFGPNDSITREQLATIMYRYANYKGYDVSKAADLSGFVDSGKIVSYARDAMKWANAAGLINGVGASKLDPKGYATRAQVAAISYRFCDAFVPKNTCKVTFELNYENAGIYTTQDVKVGEKAAQPQAPTRSGYTFTGWHTKDVGGDKFDFETAITADLTLYAHWTKNGSDTPTYTVAFDMQGHGEQVPAITGLSYGAKVTKPTDPTESGYIFGGWYKEATCETAWNFYIDTVKAATTLYAKWVQINTIADVLNTAEDDFPTSYDSGWSNDDVYYNKCYAKSGNLVFDDDDEMPATFPLDSAVTESSGNYAYTDEKATVTFQITYGKLTGIVFEHVNDSYDYFDGTYLPPVVMTVSEILAGFGNFPVATQEKPIPDNAYIALGGFKAFVDGDSLKFMDKDGNCKSIKLTGVVMEMYGVHVYTDEDGVMCAFMPMGNCQVVNYMDEDFGGIYAPPFTVTFNMNGHGTQIAQKTGVPFYSESDDLPQPESVENYRFDGWYADEDCEEELEGVMEDTTVYAKWTYVGPVDYLEWNPDTKEMDKKTVLYGTEQGKYTFFSDVKTTNSNNMVTRILDEGKFYVVNESKDISNSSLIVNGTEDNPTYLILCDGATLNAETDGYSNLQSYASIQVTDTSGTDGGVVHALVICGQENGTGKLIAGAKSASSSLWCAAIGGNNSSSDVADCGSITINGGIVEAESAIGAAIGGGSGGNGGTVTINGGTVYATATSAGAAIGSGQGVWKYGIQAGTVTINGGTVTAVNTSESGNMVGAGIGGGQSVNGAIVTINGGDVTAKGGNKAPGIGGGFPFNVDDPSEPGKTVIYGGDGGAVTINGGTVKAIGGAGAAGIGGSKEWQSNRIGGGNGGTVTINGGSVEAVAGEGAEAIGKGNGSNNTTGTVAFVDGVSFTIKAGSAAPGEDKLTTDYSNDHSAAYVSITSAP